MKKYQNFLIMWLTDFIVLYIAVLVLPGKVTAGTSIFTSFQGLVFSSFVWTIAITYTQPILKSLDLNPKGTNTLMLVYLLSNFFSLWFIARFSFMTGVGIASFWYVLLIAFVANFVQYLAWKMNSPKK